MIHRRTTDHRLENILFRLLFLRLFLPTLVLILITMGSIGLVWQRTLSRQQIKLSRSIANTVATFTDSATRVLDALGQSLVKADGHHGSIFLENTQNAYSYFETLYVIDVGGRLQQMMPADPRYKNLDLSGQPYYRQARTKQEIFISTPFISMRSGKPTVYVAKSIADERMVVGELNLGTLQVAIDTAIGGDRENVVFVADEAGSLLAHSNRKLVDEQFSLGQLPIVMQGLTTEIAQVYQSTDGLVFGAAVPLEDPPWVVVSQQSLGSALKPLAGVAAPALFLSFLIWLWVLWALRRQFVKRVVAPVGRLAVTAQRIAAGSLDEQAQADENNEIGALATAFSTMTQRLRQRIEMENIVAGISRRLMEVHAEAIDREITLSLGEMGKFVAADRCYLFMLAEDGRRMSNTHEWCSPSIQSFLDQLQELPVSEYPWLIQKARSGEDILIDHVDSFAQASHSEKADWLRQGIQSLLCVPILTEGKLKGLVGFDAVSRQRDWSAQDAKLLRLAGEIFYIAIQRKQSEIALQEAEEKYRGIFEHSTEGIFQSTVDGRFISANASLARIYGYDTPQKLIKELNDIGNQLYVDPDNRTAFLEALKQHGSVREFEVEIYRRGGEKGFILINARAVRDREGRMIHIEGMVTDITARKIALWERSKLEAQLHQSQKMESIGTLAGGIAHDFNNILSAIIGYSELAAMDNRTDSSLKQNITQILKASERAKQLVSQILTFSRQSEQKRKPLRLEPLIKECLNMLRATLPTTIDLRGSICDEIGTISADPTQIQQVIMNLCTNAAQSLPQNSGSIEVTLEEVVLTETHHFATAKVGPGNYVKLSVRDSGQGIDAESLERIFEPYFTTKAKGMGTGLGLAAVHGIIKGIGGAIDVASQIGQGATFDVYLPQRDHPEEVVKNVTETIFHGSGKVLWVDDEEVLVTLGKQMLERCGYHVTTRTSPVEALALIRGAPQRFDLLITDQTMPQMTGEHLSHEVLKIRPNIPIILCTGFSESLDAARIKSNGIAYFLMKPITLVDLSRAVHGALHHEATES